MLLDCWTLRVLKVDQLGHVVAEARLGQAPGVLAGEAGGEHHQAGGDQAGRAGQGQGGSQHRPGLRGNWRGPGQTVRGISDNILHILVIYYL